jgi:hypothetical protein
MVRKVDRVTALLIESRWILAEECRLHSLLQRRIRRLKMKVAKNSHRQKFFPTTFGSIWKDQKSLHLLSWKLLSFASSYFHIKSLIWIASKPFAIDGKKTCEGLFSASDRIEKSLQSFFYFCYSVFTPARKWMLIHCNETWNALKYLTWANGDWQELDALNRNPELWRKWSGSGKINFEIMSRFLSWKTKYYFAFFSF